MEEDVTSCTPSTLVLFTVEIAGAAFLGRYLHQPPHESDPTVNGRDGEGERLLDFLLFLHHPGRTTGGYSSSSWSLVKRKGVGISGEDEKTTRPSS